MPPLRSRSRGRGRARATRGRGTATASTIDFGDGGRLIPESTASDGDPDASPAAPAETAKKGKGKGKGKKASTTGGEKLGGTSDSEYDEVTKPVRNTLAKPRVAASMKVKKKADAPPTVVTPASPGPDLLSTLPLELLHLILILLPPPTIVRLRLVRRTWKDLIETHIHGSLAKQILPSPATAIHINTLTFPTFFELARKYHRLLRGMTVKGMVVDDSKGYDDTYPGSRSQPKKKVKIMSVTTSGADQGYYIWTYAGLLWLRQKGSHGAGTERRISLKKIVTKLTEDKAKKLPRDYSVHDKWLGSVVSYATFPNLGAVVLLKVLVQAVDPINLYHVGGARLYGYYAVRVENLEVLWFCLSEYSYREVGITVQGIATAANDKSAAGAAENFTEFLTLRSPRKASGMVRMQGTKILRTYDALLLVNPLKGTQIRTPLCHPIQAPGITTISNSAATGIPISHSDPTIHPTLRAYAVSPCGLLVAGVYSFSLPKIPVQDILYGKWGLVIWEALPDPENDIPGVVLAEYKWEAPEVTSAIKCGIIGVTFSEIGMDRTDIQEASESEGLRGKRASVATHGGKLRYNVTVKMELDHKHGFSHQLANRLRLPIYRQGVSERETLEVIEAVAHTFYLVTTFHPLPGRPPTSKLQLSTISTFFITPPPPKLDRGINTLLRLSPASLSSVSNPSLFPNHHPWGVLVTQDPVLVSRWSMEKAAVYIVVMRERGRERRLEEGGVGGVVEHVEFEVGEQNPVRRPPQPKGEAGKEECLDTSGGAAAAPKGKGKKGKDVGSGPSGSGSSSGSGTAMQIPIDDKTWPLGKHGKPLLGRKLEYEATYNELVGRDGLFGYLELGRGGCADIVLPGCVMWY